MTDTKTILVADDEADLREALATMLSTENVTVLTAKDGAEATTLALAEKPDFIILDLQMPEKDGITVMKEIRSDDWGATVPIMMLTAQSGIDSISAALEPGGTNFEYLVKTDWKLSDIAARVHDRLA